MRTWGSVTSGFFFPQSGRLARQEQMADVRNPQMPLQRRITADLEVGQPQFTLLVFQTAFDGPAAERYVQDHRQGDTRGGVAQEVLRLTRLKYVASHDQPVRAHDPFAARQPTSSALHFPHHRAFIRVLAAIGFPGLPQERLRKPADVFDRQSGSERNAGWILQPNTQTRRYFQDKSLAPLFQAPHKRSFLSIPLVGRDPGKADSLGHRAV